MLPEMLIAAALLGSGPPPPPIEAPPPPVAAAPPAAASEAASGHDATGGPLAVRGPSRILHDEALKESRGGETELTSIQTIIAGINGNVINGTYTAGTVNLSDSALSNFNGLGNLIINTGAQNSLQAGMSVVINLNQ